MLDMEEDELDLMIASTMRVRQINEIAYVLLSRAFAIPTTHIDDKWDSVKIFALGFNTEPIPASAIVMNMFGLFDNMNQGQEFALLATRIELLPMTIRQSAEHLYTYSLQEPIKKLNYDERRR